MERLPGVQFLDALGLAVFCVTGATKAIDFGLGPVQAALLGAITGIGGGMLRDVLLGEAPTVLRHELYAIPALAGAAVVVIAERPAPRARYSRCSAQVSASGLRMFGAPVRHRAHRSPRHRLGDDP